MQKINSYIHQFLTKMYEKRMTINDEATVPLGVIQKSAMMFVIRPHEYFSKLSLLKKLKAFLFGMTITEAEQKELAEHYAMNEIFGYGEDFGGYLYALNRYIESQQWDLTPLSPQDEERAQALESLSIVTRNQFHNLQTYPPLNLGLGEEYHDICWTVFPMSTKLLIRSMRYYIEIQPFYSFAQIRKSSHPRKDVIISYLYEILFLQQKIALALLKLHELGASSWKHRQKDEKPIILRVEIEALKEVDVLISYLKSSVEKIMALIAEIHDIPSIDAKKKHVQRVQLLKEKLAEKTKNTPYGLLILEYISSESLAELNDLRTGLLHKRGIAKLQPHNFNSTKEFKDLPILEALELTKKHHRRNSVVLVGALAMLVDNLMSREFLEKDNELEHRHLLAKKIAEIFFPDFPQGNTAAERPLE